MLNCGASKVETQHLASHKQKVHIYSWYYYCFRVATGCVSQANNAYIFMVFLLLPCRDGLLVRRKILRLYRLVRVGMMRLWGIA